MIQFFNTLSRHQDDFIPLRKNKVTVYSCGPTVYDYAHIGNFSTSIFMDILNRYLRYSKFQVIDAMNITDVDDKTIRNSQKNNVNLKEYTRKYEKIFLSDLKTLGITKPKFVIRATDHISEMIQLVETLINKGFAYATEDGNVYFKISAFENYGILANLDKSKLQVGGSGRVKTDEYEKESASDFVLWKAWTEEDGQVFWTSPWGKGRPGWHIECSAMSMKYLGETIDIHTGGEDLIFPHHQNEIAQSEAATGKKFVNYWLHRAYLKVDNQKMSKSLGNFYTLAQILEKYPDPMAFRYLVATSHYRVPLNFTIESLQSSATALRRIREFIQKVKHTMAIVPNDPLIMAIIAEAKEKFTAAMNDDLNTPQAIAGLFELIDKVNQVQEKEGLNKHDAKQILKFVKKIDQVWNFILSEFKPSREFSNQVQNLIDQRNEWRQKKNYAEADKIRAELAAMNVIIKDQGEETIWTI